MFKLKLKTKAGNEIKDKIIFNVFIKIKYAKSVINNTCTRASYVYEISWQKGYIKSNVVLDIKDKDSILNKKDLLSKVMLNTCIILYKYCQKHSLVPDHIRFINDNFVKLGDNKKILYFTENQCKTRQINYEVVSRLRNFREKVYPNTQFHFTDFTNFDKANIELCKLLKSE